MKSILSPDDMFGDPASQARADRDMFGILPTKQEKENLAVPQKRHRVAIASLFFGHFDVYMALAWTLQRVMGRSKTGTIVDNLRLYRGKTKSTDDFIKAINSNMGDGGIDTVVLGTCEFDLNDGTWPEELLAAWDARDDAHKFKLVCIVHNVLDVSWQRHIAPWSQRNAIRVLSISEHSDPAIRSAGYEYIPVDVHVPVLDLPAAVDPRPTRILSDAVIQGSFDTARRDYLEIFSELKESLARDPKVWGYLPLGTEDGASYVADTTLADPPFRLFLVGSGQLEIPHELKNMVLIRVGLDYPEFYALMRQMDICVPAFSADHGYYNAQASSTFAMAVECDVPILATERIKTAYAYVNDDRAVVTRPAAMRDVEALRALRTQDVSYFLHRTGIPTDSPTAHAAEAMLRLGWARPEAESRAFKQGIWRANDRVVERLLRDL
ncbi:hypothetical protein B0H13DRAFT_2544704 [Mycena leptocephala]|nr:hypothetical protein B0H13DRAFT_2544704 [Mycena leptocephala]